MVGQNGKYNEGDRVYHKESFQCGVVKLVDQEYQSVYEIGKAGGVGKQLVHESILVKWDNQPKNFFNPNTNKLDVMEVEVERDEIALIDFKYHIKKANAKRK